MTIRSFNKQVYTDIVKDMIKAKSGPFSFTITINDGNIVEYIRVEQVHYKKNDK